MAHPPHKTHASVRSSEPDAHAAPPTLNVVQRWFQTVIAHPGGVDEGVESDPARQLIHLRRDQLEQVVCRSRNLSARDRMSIYANAYYARLLECVGECFPVLKRAVGEEVFNEFAFGYLQHYPSRSYTLNQIGKDFARYLQETRPDRGSDTTAPAVNWPDFLIDLARLEWAIDKVFDGPGIEKAEVLTAGQLQAIPSSRWPEARLKPVVCLKLMQFKYPVNDYYTTVRRVAENDDVEVPGPQAQFVALTRLRYVVRRYELTRPQHALLDALSAGRTVGDAIALATQTTDMSDDELAAALHRWFSTWTAEAFFQSVELP